jgi:hypothetical protein
VKNVSEKIGEGWYEGKLDGKIGIFPANYVRFAEDNVRNRVVSHIRIHLIIAGNSFR